MGQNTSAEEPPNIVVIFVDDMGYGDLGAYGHPTIRTPHLDQMAREGMRFTQFYAASSVCTPSRAALLTGRYPIRSGLVQGLIPARVLFPNSSAGLPAEEVTMAELLKARDYATMAVGKWHLGDQPSFLPTAHGFDSYFGVPYSNDMDHVPAKGDQPEYWNIPLMRDTSIIERPAEQTTLTKRYTEEAVRFIHDYSEEPFFLYLAHSMPHIPLFTAPAFDGVSRRGRYGDVVEEIDWSVGEVLQALRDQGLAERTLVLFTSDNGPWLPQELSGGTAGLLRGGKGTTWEGGFRVPMIAWWPGAIPSGTTSAALTTTMDLLPTAAALSGAPLPGQELDGRDVSAVLMDSQPSPHDFFAYYRGTRVYAARMGSWKAHFFTQTAYPDGPLVPHDPPLLFHVEQDPGEQYNVAADHPDVIEEIRSRVEAHESKVGRSRTPSLEAEAMLDRVTMTGGTAQVQSTEPFEGEWGGNAHLWWVEARPEDRLTVPIDVSAAGDYELTGFFTRASDYGIVRLSVNGQALTPLVDGYSPGVEHSGPVSFGVVLLKEGANTVVIELLGKDARSAGYADGYLVGIDGFSIERQDAPSETP